MRPDSISRSLPAAHQERFKKCDPELQAAVEKYVNDLKKQDVDTVILGCTHYPLLYDIIAELMPGVNIISSSAAAADELRIQLEKRELLNTEKGSERKYFVSSDAELFEKKAVMILGNAVCGGVTRVKTE